MEDSFIGQQRLDSIDPPALAGGIPTLLLLTLRFSSS